MIREQSNNSCLSINSLARVIPTIRQQLEASSCWIKNEMLLNTNPWIVTSYRSNDHGLNGMLPSLSIVEQHEVTKKMVQYKR